MSQAQRLLNHLLQAEMHHSLGAYSAVCDELSRLAAERKGLVESDPTVASAIPDEVLDQTHWFNKDLRDSIHRASGAARHPGPRERSGGKDFIRAPRAEAHTWLFRFYHFAVEALEGEGGASELRPFLLTSRSQHADEERHLGGRLSRFKVRLAEAQKVLGESAAKRRPGIARLLNDCLGDTESDSLHRYVIQALTDAHLRMHYVEHLLSSDFYACFEQDKEEIADQLELCICVNTFVYSITRSLPWIFAEDEVERSLVRQLHEAPQVPQEEPTPPLCLWIPQQVTFLALFRRAYARALLGRKVEAFNDYLKVQRLMRVAYRTLSTAATRVPGALQFISALDALAEYHIGELYRADHAHTRAFEHYDRAHDRLELLAKDESMKAVLSGSRWRIQLLLSKGKAYYELGQTKQSLEWHVRAWRQFLTVAANDSQMDVNTIAVDDLATWLFQVRNDPDISKSQLVRKLQPFVEELSTVRVSGRLQGFASDILNRIGHVLFVLRLGDVAVQGRPESGEALDDYPPEGLHRLSFDCLRLAAKYDPHSTLASHNLLMARYQNPILRDQYKLPEFDAERQWPLGGGEFERFARVYEHVLLERVASSAAEFPATTILSTERGIATDLLVRFLTHTDNINVKLSQIYHYLTQPRQACRLASHADGSAIEFVCLRRYSSFFPFLPRPSAFRALGGGYFIRVHNRGTRPFGIAIDPGADFIENLYRCGFALGDIDMLMVTHDHCDHLASLDPILSLLGYRAEIGRTEFSDARKLLIVGNDSVVKRYSFFNNQTRDPVRVRHLRDWRGGGDGFAVPKDNVRLTTINSGHMDSGGHEAIGICLGVDGGPSVAITTDAGRRDDEWLKRWDAFAEADVLVAHLSSVPVSQLRQLAGLEVNDANLKKLWDGIGRGEELRRRVKFAFWDEGRRKRKRASAGLFGRIDKRFSPPANHLYLGAVIELARRFAEKRPRPGLFVVSELREELGTFRTKVAAGLNKHVFKSENGVGSKAVTADVGLHVMIDAASTKVLCSTCELDNDRTGDERYHEAHEIHEVCVKGENEGVFYNCRTHDPSQLRDPTFVERMERYDVFGRGAIR